MDKTGEARSVKEWVFGLFHRKPATPLYVPTPEDEEDDIRFGNVPLSTEDLFHWAIEHDDLRCLRHTIRKGIDPTCDYETAIRQFAERGNTDAVRFLAPFSKKKSDGLAKALIKAAENGHAECVKELLPYADPDAFGSKALWSSALEQKKESVRLLAPVSDIMNAIHLIRSIGDERNYSERYIKDAENLILRVVKEELARMRESDGKSVFTPQNLLTAAALNSDADAMKKALASGADHRKDQFLALRLSLFNGDTDCIAQLIAFAPPKDDVFDKALLDCTNEGKTDMVRFLIPLSDPKRFGSKALRVAARKRNAEMTDMLIPVSSVNDAISRIKSDAGEFDEVLAEEDIGFLNSRVEHIMLKSRVSERTASPMDKNTL